ncbi:MAG: phospholipid carrier-dependent glycosyltransferase [Planctomycetaceae bacterium]|nr:phospholipid carrier-dependent glycosyltransferase [Planctomycetales bacterium]MCB9927338.1 phospholipid carrier-dependent glycosyltransferase [Planctomycetaceae bacterium]
MTDPKRSLVLSLFLLPDQVICSWCDGDWSRFAILDRLPLVVATATILVIAYLAGRLVLESIRADKQLAQLELSVFAVGVGLNIISLYTLLVGLAGGLQLRSAFFVPAAATTAASLWRARDWRKSIKIDLKGDSLRQSSVWMCIPFVIAIAAGSVLPPWHFDTREYHAQVPKEWYQQGEVDFMPHNVYGNMPLGAEMHAIVGSNLMYGEQNWWWGALIGKAVIGCYAPLTALALFAFGRRFLSQTAGAISAFIFISTPWIAHVSTSGLIDGASAFYLFAAFYSMMIWYEQLRLRQSSSADLFLPGFLAGSAVACKYPAVLFVVFPGCIAAACLPFGKLHIRPVVTFTLAVALACGLWFGKNLVLAENPTYPLLYKLFGGKTRTVEKDVQWTTAHGPPHDPHGRSFTWNFLRSSAELLLWRSEFASPLLVPLAMVGLLTRRHRTALVASIVLVAFNILVWWFLTHRIDRFLVPILPLVAVIAGIGATSFCDIRWRRVVTAALCFGFAFNLLFVVSPLPGDNRFLTSYEFLRRDEPTDGPFSAERTHRVHKYLNTHVQPGFAVMAVGEAQVFDLNMPVYYNTCFDDCVFEAMMKGRTADERIKMLRSKRISHVFVFWYELDRYRSPGNYGYSDYVTPELVQNEFVDQGILREVPLGLDTGNSQLFEVNGWRTWDGE